MENFEQKQQTVVDLLSAGYLDAARQLAAANSHSLQHQIASFNRGTDELSAMLHMAAANSSQLPQLIIGSSLYQAVIGLLQKYASTLQERGLYEAVATELLRCTQTSTSVN